jgi:hypothetical protein
MEQTESAQDDGLNELDERAEEVVLSWRVQLAAAALPRAMQEVSGANRSVSVGAAAKLALQHADAVLDLILLPHKG